MARLWFLDTGSSNDCFGLSGYGCIYPDQIDWVVQEHRSIPKDDISKGRGMMFMHIPIVEMMMMYNQRNFKGTNGER